MATEARLTSRGGAFSAAALLLAGATLQIAGAPSAPAGRQPAPAREPLSGHVVLVELFTSQGCSTCPPADRLLTTIAEEGAGRVVALSFHVDFWNTTAWMDPFSKKEWTERQIAYGRSFGLTQIYTPQAVVDGAAELAGSEDRRLRAAIDTAASRPAARISLGLEPADSRVLVSTEVDLPEALRNRRFDLLLAVFETGLVTSVSRGENGGRTLRNDFVVRSLDHAATLPAGGPNPTRHETTLKLARDWKGSRLGVAAFVQDPRSLEVRGAGARLLSTAGSGAPPKNP